MTIEEIKSCSLEILDFFDSVCSRYGVRYFLCGGTLLGAVRHKGFIPWDDDIDVMMLREDYNRLYEVWPKDSPFQFLRHENNPFFPYAYGKAVDKRTIKIEPIRKVCQQIGVDIDIFPIDNIPDNESEAIAFFKDIERYQRRLSLQTALYGESNGIIRTIVKNSRLFWYRFLEDIGVTSIDKIVTSFSLLAQKFNTEDTMYCGITTISHYGIREKNLRKGYEDVVYVSFEGKQLPAPSGYVHYLESLYGMNYMQLPPIEKRITHHGYKAFWR